MKWSDHFTRRSDRFHIKGSQSVLSRAEFEPDRHGILDRLLKSLERKKIGSYTECSSSPVNATSYSSWYWFLDGGLTIEGGNYFPGYHGAYVKGFKAARYAFFLLGFDQPRRFKDEPSQIPLPRIADLEAKLASTPIGTLNLATKAPRSAISRNALNQYRLSARAGLSGGVTPFSSLEAILDRIDDLTVVSNALATNSDPIWTDLRNAVGARISPERGSGRSQPQAGIPSQNSPTRQGVEGRFRTTLEVNTTQEAASEIARMLETDFRERRGITAIQLEDLGGSS